MYRILQLLMPAELDECRAIAASSQFVDGRVSNPHNKAKQNEQLHDRASHDRASKILLEAFRRNEEFREFSFPALVSPPMLTRYKPGMQYGLHADSPYIPLPGGGQLRSDLSCTVFVSEPDDYDGGALHVMIGDADVRFKLSAGDAVIYPSDTLHEVEPVTRGERLVAITFIQSRVPDPFRRNVLFTLNAIGALEGLNMRPENFTRLQLVQSQLLRHWGEQP